MGVDDRTPARSAGGAPDRPRRPARFGYMPEERGLYPKTPSLRQLTYLAGCTGWSGRPASARAQLAGAVRAGERATTRSSSSRSATSSGSSSRRPWSTTRCCWCSTSRSAASTRSAWTRSARCCSSGPRRACRSCSPATSSSSSSGCAMRWPSSTRSAGGRGHGRRAPRAAPAPDAAGRGRTADGLARRPRRRPPAHPRRRRRCCSSCRRRRRPAGAGRGPSAGRVRHFGGSADAERALPRGGAGPRAWHDPTPRWRDDQDLAARRSRSSPSASAAGRS
jgi:hypothetical protein